MAIIKGPLITQDAADLIERELNLRKNDRWQCLRVEVLDLGEELQLVFQVDEKQGDDDENVEAILSLCERLLTSNIPERIPIRADSPSWFVSIDYANGGDWKPDRRLAIAGTSGGWNSAAPDWRPRHGSKEDLEGSSMPVNDRAKWKSRR